MISAASLTQIAFLGELAQQDRGEPEKAAERVGKISTTARQAIKSLDELYGPSSAQRHAGALIEYAGQFALDYLRLADIRCRLDFPEQSPPRELSTDLRHNLFLAIRRRCTTSSSTRKPPKSGCASSFPTGRWKSPLRTTAGALTGNRTSAGGRIAEHAPAPGGHRWECRVESQAGTGTRSACSCRGRGIRPDITVSPNKKPGCADSNVRSIA